MNSEIIFEYFPSLNEEQSEKIKKLGKLYNFYNEQVNLISRKDIKNLYEHHILHSLAIGKIVNFEEKTRVIDVGSGGGLPGIPLAILFPQTSFILIDSIKKKINIVNSIIQDLKMQNVTTVWDRVEKCKEKFDYVVGRGVCCFDKF
ncbi:MAG: 16S rRNA (guanine(527)-N(7))-methyltransferase RsmG, partial [Cytophagales bacterium]|nr:16S rRNA (guanine(527)-N(7))-methyltransferase RsmG [Cytophagales bacterium]